MNEINEQKVLNLKDSPFKTSILSHKMLNLVYLEQLSHIKDCLKNTLNLEYNEDSMQLMTLLMLKNIYHSQSIDYTIYTHIEKSICLFLSGNRNYYKALKN